MRAFCVPKAAALVCLGLAAGARGQVLSLRDGASPAGQEGGNMLAGQARALRPALAAQLGRPAVMAEDDEVSLLPLLVQFEPGSARLTVSATRALDHLGQALDAGPLAGERLQIEGHADARGSPDANKDISERRAMAVAAYLEQNYAISPKRLACTGKGAASPSRRIVLIARVTSG